jgi:hypothetical protein
MIIIGWGRIVEKVFFYGKEDAAHSTNYLEEFLSIFSFDWK